MPKKVLRNKRGQIVGAKGMKVACPNSPYYNIAPAALPITTCVPDAVCGCSKTITIKHADIPDSFEPTLWGTNKWAASYGRRNLVEAFNSWEQYHYEFTAHSIRVMAPKWDLAHLFLTISIWIQQFRAWALRQGAHAVDPDDFPEGPLRCDVLAAVIDRVTTLSTETTRTSGREPPDGLPPTDTPLLNRQNPTPNQR